MAKLINDEKNIHIELCLKNNEYLDINCANPDFENWIPFNLRIDIANNTRFLLSGNETFSLMELKDFFTNFEKLCKGQITQCYFLPIEFYFELILELHEEEQLIETSFWFNKGILTNGREHGYSEGLRFYVEKENFTLFIRELKQELVRLAENSKT